MRITTTFLFFAVLMVGNAFAADDPGTSGAQSNNAILIMGTASAGIEERAFIATESDCPYLECPIVFPCDARFLPDGRIQFRNCAVIMKTVSEDRMFDGEYYLADMSANFDSDWTGPIWGSFRSCNRLGILLDNGWIGTFDGQVFRDSTRNQIIYRVGHGIGDNENLTFKSTSAWTSDDGNMVGIIRNTKKD